MTRAKRSRKKAQPKSASSTERLIRSLLENRVTAARVRELFYWSKEPGLLHVFRAIASMPEETREALEMFVGLTAQPGSVAASFNARGVLQLSSTDFARTALIAQCAAEDESPRVLN